MKKIDLLFPFALCAALLGCATLAFALDDTHDDRLAVSTQVAALEAGVSPHVLMAP
jgi:hypothetical protein